MQQTKAGIFQRAIKMDPNAYLELVSVESAFSDIMVRLPLLPFFALIVRAGNSQ